MAPAQGRLSHQLSSGIRPDACDNDGVKGRDEEATLHLGTKAGAGQTLMMGSMGEVKKQHYTWGLKLERGRP